MQLSSDDLTDYVAAVAALLERYGVVLDLPTSGAIALDEAPSGIASFALTGALPGGNRPPLSQLAVREKWRPIGEGIFERAEYAYELLDHERDFRRAFHLHDASDFVRRYLVAVHEHCERPVGEAPCEHVAGAPVRDAYAGALALIRVWTDPNIPDCAALDCLG